MATFVAAATLAAGPVGPGRATTRATVACFRARATIVGTAGADRIQGTAGRDVIAGRGGDDVILGGDARDRICGGAGQDVLDGRYGADLVDGAGGNDRLRGGPGDDLLLAGAGHDRAEGGDGRDDRDTLVGGSGRDELFGGDGSDDADYLFGGGGLDFMDGGLGGRDELFGGPGNDRMSDGLVSYELSASAVEVDLGPGRSGPTATGEGHDYLGNVSDVTGSPFDDVILGSAARNVLRGGDGDDVISAREGFDRVDGGGGDDALDGGADGDVLVFEDSPSGVSASLSSGAGEGAGTVALTGFESVEGSHYDDRLTGDDARNEIYGSYGDNELYGLGGDDYLEFAESGDAGDGLDECMWAFVDNCEWSGHFDPPSWPYLDTPRQQQDVTRLDAVRGGIAGGIGGPDDETIVVSIRRMTPDGCSWWRARPKRFVRGSCGVAIGNEVSGAGSGWSMAVGADLPPGAYRVSVTWGSGRLGSFECIGAFAPMCVWFEVPRS